MSEIARELARINATLEDIQSLLSSMAMLWIAKDTDDPDGPVEVGRGTWFRKRWSTGRVGKWHLAWRSFDGLDGHKHWYCRCDQTSRSRYDSVVLETSLDRPSGDTCSEVAS